MHFFLRDTRSTSKKFNTKLAFKLVNRAMDANILLSIKLVELFVFLIRSQHTDLFLGLLK